MKKIRIEHEAGSLKPDMWSAGGVILRKLDNETEILICERYSENLIALPKGKPNEGENEEPKSKV